MKKGFTLVELLAVIVILSIIALITIPMISNVIEKSKLGAMEDSAYGLIEAANYYYAEHMNEMNSNKIFVIENGIGTSEEKLNYKGKIEGNAKILLASNGKVALCLTNGKSYAKKGITDSKVVMHTVSEATTCDITTSENGDVVIDITGGSTSDTINIKLEDMQRQIDEISSNLEIIKRHLIWTHPKYYTTEYMYFQGQTLSLDLREYDAVEIYYGTYTRKSLTSNIYLKSDSITSKMVINEISTPSGYYLITQTRVIKITDSGIEFNNAWYGAVGVAGFEEQKGEYCVPFKIYGIKF